MNHLYLCCYDIQDDKRRGKVYRTLKKYQSGGQYSAYECYLTDLQKKQLEKQLSSIIEEADTLHFQRLQLCHETICLGRACQPMPSDFLYLG